MLLILIMTSGWVEINQLWLFKFFDRRVQFLLWRKHRLLYGTNQSFSIWLLQVMFLNNKEILFCFSLYKQKQANCDVVVLGVVVIVAMAV